MQTTTFISVKGMTRQYRKVCRKLGIEFPKKGPFHLTAKGVGPVAVEDVKAGKTYRVEPRPRPLTIWKRKGMANEKVPAVINGKLVWTKKARMLGNRPGYRSDDGRWTCYPTGSKLFLLADGFRELGQLTGSLAFCKATAEAATNDSRQNEAM